MNSIAHIRKLDRIQVERTLPCVLCGLSAGPGSIEVVLTPHSLLKISEMDTERLSVHMPTMPVTQNSCHQREAGRGQTARGSARSIAVHLVLGGTWSSHVGGGDFHGSIVPSSTIWSAWIRTQFPDARSYTEYSAFQVRRSDGPWKHPRMTYTSDILKCKRPAS